MPLANYPHWVENDDDPDSRADQGGRAGLDNMEKASRNRDRRTELTAPLGSGFGVAMLLPTFKSSFISHITNAARDDTHYVCLILRTIAPRLGF